MAEAFWPMPLMHSQTDQKGMCVCDDMLKDILINGLLFTLSNGKVSHMLSMSINKDDSNGNSQKVSTIYEQT